MLRRTYLFLLCIRVYFALRPSYLHPDEVFQGPEVIAGTCSNDSIEIDGWRGRQRIAQL